MTLQNAPGKPKERQVAMVMDLNKCLGCQTCTIACKKMWNTDQGTDYAYWNNVETMPGKAVEGILWKADRERPWRMHAEGLGTMQRSDAPQDWKVAAEWAHGRWLVTFEIADWPLLAQFKQVAFAIWQGERQDRGGLKSVSPGWLAAV